MHVRPRSKIYLVEVGANNQVIANEQIVSAGNVLELVVSLNKVTLKLMRRFVDGNNISVRAVIEGHQKFYVGKSFAVNFSEQRQIFIESVIEHDNQTDFRQAERPAVNFKVKYYGLVRRLNLFGKLFSQRGKVVNVGIDPRHEDVIINMRWEDMNILRLLAVKEQFVFAEDARNFKVANAIARMQRHECNVTNARFNGSALSLKSQIRTFKFI